MIIHRLLQFLDLYTIPFWLSRQMWSFTIPSWTTLSKSCFCFHWYSHSLCVSQKGKKKKSYCLFVHDISPSICLLPPSNFSFPHFSYSHVPNHDCLFCSFSKIFQHGSFINGVWCLLYIDMCVCLYLYLYLLLFSQLA